MSKDEVEEAIAFYLSSEVNESFRKELTFAPKYKKRRVEVDCRDGFEERVFNGYRVEER